MRCGQEEESVPLTMADTFSGADTPAGWPGHLWLEGRTVVHLQSDQERPSHMPRGPVAKSRTGFMNPAMAPARTRSVLLLQDALEHGWLVDDRPIRALDALCATGIRVRRWRNEIAPELQERLHITANDLDSKALDWALSSVRQNRTNGSFPMLDDEQVPIEQITENGINFQRYDARMAMIQGSFQWIDLDPFGSPVQFLDTALQGLGRVGVLEVTATDTAALTGSSSTSGLRRYGHNGIVDHYAHDDAVRVLLGTIATSAARLDRSIEPLLALFDGHHVRVSVIVRKSKLGADENRQKMGWRVRHDDIPYTFVKHPSPEQIEHSSGPMWIGPLWNEEITGRMTEDHAVECCLPKETDLTTEGDMDLEWSDLDQVYAERELRRSVRYISDASSLLSSEHLLLPYDQIAPWAKAASMPSMVDLIAALSEEGYRTARVPDLRPYIATKAPYEVVLEMVRKMDSTE